MTGQVGPDHGNPDTDIPDPTGNNLNRTVSDQIDNFRTDFGSKFQDKYQNNRLTPPWRHTFRIIRRAGHADTKSPGTGKRGSYKSIRDLKPKKAGLQWVDQDAQGIKQDMLSEITQSLAGAGLQGQFRVIVRVCPMIDDHHQDQNNCGCGCSS